MDFVALYKQWTGRTGQTELGDFFEWLASSCAVAAGTVMTDDEIGTIAYLAGATPEETDEALMASAWP